MGNINKTSRFTRCHLTKKKKKNLSNSLLVFEIPTEPWSLAQTFSSSTMSFYHHRESRISFKDVLSAMLLQEGSVAYYHPICVALKPNPGKYK